MILLAHNIGYNEHSNYNTREEILNFKGDITFDGVYRNVWENRDILRVKLDQGYKVVLFITGTYVGGNNKFDREDIPYEQFCDWNQLFELINMGCEPAWHTWNHKDLTILADKELMKELKSPFYMPKFAYPYGYFNERVIKFVKEAGYKQAYTVFDGDNSDYQLTRVMI